VSDVQPIRPGEVQHQEPGPSEEALAALERELYELRQEISALRQQIATLRSENTALAVQARQGRGLLEALGGLPPGHFHSPYPSAADIRRSARFWSAPTTELPAIDLNVSGQLELLEAFADYQADIPFPERREQGCRYYYRNGVFSAADAIAFYSMIRHLRPRRIVEIGSGFSSAVALDTNERFFDYEIECTFIDPDPARLDELLQPDDLERVMFVRSEVQNVPLSAYDSLEANDILFIDSTHVAKAGSDVNHLFFELLPRLRTGVHVHVHDVFYPFDYRRDWLEKNRWAWTEAYLLRAFLQYNRAFEIRLFNDFLRLFHRDAIARVAPAMLIQHGGSIWLQRRPDR
jgi:hypothetical protein